MKNMIAKDKRSSLFTASLYMTKKRCMSLTAGEQLSANKPKEATAAATTATATAAATTTTPSKEILVHETW
jgi:hypothetical protein